MTDPLDEIKARRDEAEPARHGLIILPEKSLDDIDTLVGEVERLRRLVNKPLFAIWQQVEAETREKWFGEHDLREENRRLRELLGRLEWAHDAYEGSGGGACPVCYGGGVHSPDCWLAKELHPNENDPPPPK